MAAQTLIRLLDSNRRATPAALVTLALYPLEPAVRGHCRSVELGQHRGAPLGCLRARKWSSAFSLKSLIHRGSDLNSEIFSTISRFNPFRALYR